MKIKFKKIHYLILSLSIVLVIGGVVSSYFIFLKPIDGKMKGYQDTLTSEKASLQAILMQVEEMGNASPESSYQLQKRVPVVPLLEQVLLMVEKVEVMSRAQVTNIGISTEEAGDPAAEPEVAPPPTEPTLGNGEAGAEKLPVALPPGTKKVTITLSVESKDYEGMQDFIRRLEIQDRIVNVEGLTFSGSEKKEEETAFQYTVVFSAFYASGLTGLEDGIPHVDVPDGSDKKNPLKQ